MDDVFGNSSTETVISVPDDLDPKDEATSLDDPKRNTSPSDKFFTEIKTLESLMKYAKNLEKRNLKTEKELNKENYCRHLPSICVSAKSSFCRRRKDGTVVRVPHPSVLKHSHSALIQSFPIAYPRPRSYSVPKTSGVHPYQNVRTCFSSLPYLNTPSYVNLPESMTTDFPDPRKLCSTLSLNSNSSSCDSSNPRRPPSSQSNNSYIKLWTGFPDTSEDSLFNHSQYPSASGYVSMASPYIHSPNSSILSHIANQLSSFGSGDQPVDIFCSFCPRPFTQESSLKSHIETIHSQDLQDILSSDSVYIHFCPLCPGRFLVLNLLPSHILEFHREYILDLLHSQDRLQDKDEINCPYCPKTVPSPRFKEDLLCHIVKRHNAEYEATIQSLYQPVECLKIDVLNALGSRDLASLSLKTSTPGLSMKFKDLGCREDAPNADEYPVLEETWNSHSGAQFESKAGKSKKARRCMNVSKGILRTQTDLSRKHSVKRELRFSVPAVTNEELFIPESPEAGSLEMTADFTGDYDLGSNLDVRSGIPIRVDSLSSADFIELTNLPRRKKRRLGAGGNSKKPFKKSKSESLQLVENVFEGLRSIGCGKPKHKTVVATRTFKKPKAVACPRASVAESVDSVAKNGISIPPPPSEVQMSASGDPPEGVLGSETSPFGNMKLYSPLKMFRCNGCRIRYSDNESLAEHVRAKHRNLLGFLKPQFGCGICSARFYENKYLVKHCLQHHTSLLEIRSPKKNNNITIYRFTND